MFSLHHSNPSRSKTTASVVCNISSLVEILSVAKSTAVLVLCSTTTYDIRNQFQHAIHILLISACMVYCLIIL